MEFLFFFVFYLTSKSWYFPSYLSYLNFQTYFFTLIFFWHILLLFPFLFLTSNLTDYFLLQAFPQFPAPFFYSFLPSSFLRLRPFLTTATNMESGGGQKWSKSQSLCFKGFAGFLKKCELRGQLRGLLNNFQFCFVTINFYFEPKIFPFQAQNFSLPNTKSNLSVQFFISFWSKNFCL